MSRDPLEGYRPSDTAGPVFPSAPPVSAGVPAPSWTPERGSRTKTIVLVIVASLIAMIAGGVGYFLTMQHAALVPTTKPTGEMVVKQGPPPPDPPSPAPSGTPK